MTDLSLFKVSRHAVSMLIPFLFVDCNCKDVVGSSERRKKVKALALEGLTFESITFEMVNDEAAYSVMTANKNFKRAFDSNALTSRSKLVQYCNKRAFEAFGDAV